jgi:O-antigen/teichoic acid export membrane protein
MNLPRLKQAALSGARWTLAARVALQLFTWPITILVMRLLEPSDYGLFAIAMVVTGFIMLFSELGLSFALVQAEAVNEELARDACTVILLLNLAVMIALLLLAPQVADWFDEPGITLLMQVLTLELLLTSLSMVPQAMLERQLRFRELSLAMVAAGATGALVTLVCAWFDAGVWSLVAGYLAQAFVRAAMMIWFHGRVIWPTPGLRLSRIRPMVRFSSHVIASRALWYWYGQADQVILARLQHASQLGFYSVASQLAMLPASKAMEAINKVAFPILAQLRAAPNELKQTHRRLVSLVAMYGLSVCWGLAAVAPEFIALVLGDKWHLATTPLMLLALIAPLRMLSALHNTIATAVGMPHTATRELAYASVLVPGAVLAGAWWGGLDGAALAWVVAYPVVYLLSNALTCAAVGSRPREGLQPVLAPAIAGLAMLGTIGLLRRQLGAELPLPLLLAAEIAAGAVVFPVCLQLVAPALMREARALVRDLLRPKRASDWAAQGPQ